MTLQATDMTFYFLNFEHETVEIVELRIFGGCAVVKGRKGNMRAAKRQGLDLEYQVIQQNCGLGKARSNRSGLLRFQGVLRGLPLRFYNDQ